MEDAQWLMSFGVPADEIARRVGTKRSTLHRWFSGKDYKVASYFDPRYGS